MFEIHWQGSCFSSQKCTPAEFAVLPSVWNRTQMLLTRCFVWPTQIAMSDISLLKNTCLPLLSTSFTESEPCPKTDPHKTLGWDQLWLVVSAKLRSPWQHDCCHKYLFASSSEPLTFVSCLASRLATCRTWKDSNKDPFISTPHCTVSKR